jgi:hypothetical protein
MKTSSRIRTPLPVAPAPRPRLELKYVYPEYTSAGKLTGHTRIKSIKSLKVEYEGDRPYVVLPVGKIAKELKEIHVRDAAKVSATLMYVKA